ncbi:MAG TPA: pirin family protein [Saprospiraceae bacterium]|nr:pirin family protein [Saprospiraceae bacterium]
MYFNKMNIKKLIKIIRPGQPHMVGDGFRVHNFIPGASTMQEMDPFIMLDYGSKYTFPPAPVPRGVGVHPHRGFETVTIAYKGKIEHGDSSGGGGIISEGDVQWMTAASGVLHREFHESEWSKQGGDFQMVQLWVNLPARDKMSPPKYQAIKNADIPVVLLPNDDGKVEVIAGEFQGQSGAASTFSPVDLLNVHLKKGGKTEFYFPAHYTTTLLTIEGSVRINGEDELPQDHFALFSREGETFSVEAIEDTIVLVLSGEPLHEPIVAHGPFVMNTKAEILQAFDDFNTGKFGHLAD